MNISRRAFGKRTAKLFLLLAAAPMVFTTGCNIVQDLINYIPWITRGLNAISSILGSFMPAEAQAIIGVIVGALADLQATLVEYQADPVLADKATLLAKIETFLKDIVANFQQFLDALAVNGPIAAVILGIIEVVLSTISWFAGQFASTTGRPALAIAHPMSLRAQNQYLFITPVKRSIKQFKAAFNQVVYANGHPEVQMY